MDGKTRKHRINDGRKWGKMEGYTEEEKGYIWLDSFQIEEGEKGDCWRRRGAPRDWRGISAFSENR